MKNEKMSYKSVFISSATLLIIAVMWLFIFDNIRMGIVFILISVAYCVIGFLVKKNTKKINDDSFDKKQAS